MEPECLNFLPQNESSEFNLDAVNNFAEGGVVSVNGNLKLYQKFLLTI
jgi:hypothetical protein